ncbi:MAG: MHYT domain-containing protein [Micromonosporaceae bacterium]
MPVHVEHFTYGWLTPTLSYALSVVGSMLGLVCTARARAVTDTGVRARWLVLAAWSIGGTGIWVMHFMAMIGFSVPGQSVRYDIPVTVASWITAMVVVGIGLFIVGFGQPSAFKIMIAGVFTGVGVAAMHYTGMAAMRVAGIQSYDSTLVALSVIIAVVAATVALWFTVNLQRGSAILVAALIMGLAVCGMHYTGMYALRVLVQETARPAEGITPITFLAPIAIFVIAVVITLASALINRSGTDGPPTGDITEGGARPGGTASSDRPAIRSTPSSFVPRPVR